jgi:signal peptidase I
VPKKRKVLVTAKPRETVVESLASMAGILVTGLFIITFGLQAFAIPSSSMEDTLLIGDHVLVNREEFAPPTHWMGPLLPHRDIQRGDIVVFLSPEEPGVFIVKRIIGVPGDRIHLRAGAVFRNGEKLVEPYVRHKMANYDPYRDDFPAVAPLGMYGVTSQEWQHTLASYIKEDDVLVPPNNYFGMGDNRDVSKDSRYWGFIPMKNVIGRPMFVYWSFVTPADEYDKRGAADRLQVLAHTIVHFFDETRWSRPLRIVR